MYDGLEEGLDLVDYEVEGNTEFHKRVLHGRRHKIHAARGHQWMEFLTWY